MSFSLFGDGGPDRGGDLYDQGRFCGRAEVQDDAQLVGEHFFCRFYHLGGAVGCGFHDATFVHAERGEHSGVVTINTT
jgi:hypothetical protein